MAEGVRTPNLPLGVSIGEFLGNEIVGNTRSLKRFPRASVLGALDSLVSGMQVGGGVVFITEAQADSNLLYPSKQMALVTSDPDTSRNGVYQKLGLSGAGSWLRVADLPNEIIQFTVTGGTGDAILASMSPQVPTTPSGKIYIIVPTAANTGAITINGITVKNGLNSTPAANTFLNGVPVSMIWAGDHYQILTSLPVDTAGVVSDAQAARDLASGYATAAASSASALGNQVHQYDTRALAAAATIPTGVLAIRVTRYATGHPVTFAVYVPGTISGPDAFQEAGGHYWQLDLSGGNHNSAWFGAKGDGVNNDTTPLQSYATATPLLRLINGTFKVTSAITLSGVGCGIVGVSPGQSIINVVSTTAKGIIFPNASQPYLANLAIKRDASTPATSGAIGIDLSLGTNQGVFENVLIDGHYLGWQLGSTDSARAARCTTQNCISHGVLMTPTGSNSQLQWQLDDDFLVTQCGGHGIRVLSTTSVVQCTMGEWRSVQTFANSGRGISVEGLSSHPVQGLRIRAAFLGNDGDHELYLDTYNTNAYAHIIEAIEIEAAGTDVTGPLLGNAASHSGCGIFATANNLLIDVSDPIIINNSLEGIKSSATQLIVNGGVISNNGLATPNTYAGVNVVAGRATIQDSRISDSVAGLSQKYNIILAAGTDGHMIAHNDLRLYFTGAIQNLSTGTTNKIIDNHGWNPGTQTQPTPGASPWTYTAGPSPETIYISGGTVSSITFVPSALGVVPNAGTTTIQLGPNEAIVVTYSSAPSIVRMIH